MTTLLRSTLRVAVWCASLAGLGVSLWNVNVGPDPHEVLDLDGLTSWAQLARPDELAATLLRYAGLVGIGWLSFVTILTLALQLAGAPRLAVSVARMLPAVARRALRPVAAGSLVASVALSPAIGASAQTVPQPTTTVDNSAVLESLPSPTATLTHVPDDWPALIYPSTVDELEAVGLPLATATQAATWFVEPGDNLWTIAERTSPADATLVDVGQRWLTIIELNRDTLPSPNNPDLIHPGMTIQLPETDI